MIKKRTDFRSVQGFFSELLNLAYQTYQGVVPMQKTLHDLITSTTWLDVEALLNEYYPDENVAFFKQLYWKLYNITPTENTQNAELHLDTFTEDDDDITTEDLYYEIDHYNEITDEAWAMYLGFYLTEETLETIEAAEIVTHLLFEFTYGEIEYMIQ